MSDITTDDILAEADKLDRRSLKVLIDSWDKRAKSLAADAIVFEKKANLASAERSSKMAQTYGEVVTALRHKYEQDE
jgi:hypothetical protein